MNTPKTHKGIYYWPTYEAAIRWAASNGWPARAVPFMIGWAIQAGPSGNYAGPGETPRQWRAK